MNFQVIFVYLTSLLFIFFTIYFTFKLNKNYQKSFLTNYLYFIITFNILGFIKFILTYLAPSLLGDTSWHTLKETHILLLFLVFPLVPLCAYFFVNFIFKFGEEKLPPSLKNGYIYFWFLMCLGFALGLYFLKEKQNKTILSYISNIYILVITFILIMAFVKMFFGFKKLKDLYKKKALRIISIIYLVNIIIYLIILINFSSYYFGSFIEFVFLFSVNLYPLIYLQNFLKKYYLNFSLKDDREIKWDNLFLKYKITKRETEIIYLLYNGKNNSDIENELFISKKTVKNHIFHIYQKLEVKNRLQFNNLIRNFPKET